MGETFTWTDAKQDFLEEMARGGASGTQIAKALGTTRSAVLGRCFRTAVKLHGKAGPKLKAPKPPKIPGKRGRKPQPDHVKLLAMAAHFAGLSLRQAGAEAGVTDVTVSNWLRREPALAARARAIAFNARYAAGASTVSPLPRAKTGHRINPDTGRQIRGFSAMDPARVATIRAKGHQVRRAKFGMASGHGPV